MRISFVLLVVSAVAVCASGNCIDSKALGNLMVEAFDMLRETNPGPVTWHTVHRDRWITIGNGEVFGLKNMNLSALPIVKCTKSGVASVKAEIEIHNVRIVYPWEFSKWIVQKKGLVYGEVNTINAEVYFLRSENPDTPLVLNKFNIVKVDQADVRVTGASYVTWLISRIASQVANLLRKTIADLLEDEVGHSIVETLNGIKGVRQIINNVEKF